MDNFMHRGGRMLGNSKLYGNNRPQDSEWRFGDSRMLDPSRSRKDLHIPETSRQREDFRMQDSRLLLESRMEPNYSPPTMYDNPEVQGSVRIPSRTHGGSQLQREVRTHQNLRMESSSRLPESSRLYDVPLQDQVKPRSSAVAYDYNHRRSDDSVPNDSKFMNSQEDMRSRRNYIIEENNGAKQEFFDILPSKNSLKINLDILSGKSSLGPVATPSSSHILTPSLTSSSGPQPGDGMRHIGIRDLYSKEKKSKAFDYLKTWRLKMNMPTDAFLLEKEVTVGNQQQGVDGLPPLACDDWYTQPPTTEPRRASIDPEWNYSGNSFVENETYGERPINKYGNMRHVSYGESLPNQSLEGDRSGNPPWKWNKELSSGQNQGGKRDFESMALGQLVNPVHRDGRFLHDVVQPKRPRLSSSIMQSERGGTMEQYTSVIPEQETLSHNMMDNDDAKFKGSLGSSFYESQSDWIPPFQGKPIMDSSQFSRSCDIGSENVSSRHKLPYGELKGALGRERSQTSYAHSRDVKNVCHLSTERSPEPLRRHRFSEPQDRASRLSGERASREFGQFPPDQDRLPPNKVFLSSAPYSLEMTPESCQGTRSNRSPARVRSPGMFIRGKSPASFSQRKSQGAVPSGKYSNPHARDHSSPWRKGRSPQPGRDRATRSDRGRSPAPGGLESSAGRLPGRPRLCVSSGRQRSPGTQEMPDASKRERTPDLARRVKQSEFGRGRSPAHQIRERLPRSSRTEQLPVSPGSERLFECGRWRSPRRSLDPSGREKSPGRFRRERPQESSERGKLPEVFSRGRTQVISSAGLRSPGPVGGQSSGPLKRGRSTGKLHVGRSGSPGVSEKRNFLSGLSSKSARDKSPEPKRNRSCGTSGRARSPGASGSDRSPRLLGKGKQTDAPGRRSPRLLVTGKPSNFIKGGSTEQQQSRPVSATTGVSVERKAVKHEEASLSSHHSRGRSPMKGRSLIGTRLRSESFFDGKQRATVDRFPRIGNRSPQSPIKKMLDHEQKSGTLYMNEYKDCRMERDRSPYLEEVSLSPRSSRYWSPTRRVSVNMRAHHSRKRSTSVDTLQRGCSPVSIQSEDNIHRNIYSQEPFFPDIKGHIPQEHASHIYRSYSPLSVDGFTSSRKNDLAVEGNKSGRQQERQSVSSREVSFVTTGRQSMQKVHNTEDTWREHNKDRGGKCVNDRKVTSGKTFHTKDVTSTNSTKYIEKPDGPLLEEEVDDEDLRIHLLRLREQKVEMKLIKLEEESKETELKLLELKKNKTAVIETNPIEKDGRYSEKEPFQSHGRRHEAYTWKRLHSTSPQRERYRRQHKRF